MRLRDHIAGLIQRKSVEVDLAFYDSSDFYDHLHRARIDSNFRPIQLIEDTGVLLQNGITVVAMIVIVARYSALLPLAILLSTLPAVLVVVRAGMRSHEWSRRATAEERRAWYYDALLTERQSAMEIRLFASAEFFHEAFSSVRRKLRSEQ